VTGCLGAAVRVAGVSVALPVDTLGCGERIATAFDLYALVIDTVCFNGPAIMDCLPVQQAKDALAEVSSSCDFAADMPSDCRQAAEYARGVVARFLSNPPPLCVDGDTCDQGRTTVMATVAMAIECLDLEPIMAMTSGARVNVAATCAGAVQLLRDVEPLVRACLEGVDTTCATVQQSVAQVVASGTGCLGAILTEAGVPQVVSKDGSRPNGVCASAAKSVKATVAGAVATLEACVAKTQPRCKTAVDTAVAAGLLVAGCINDTLGAFGFEQMLVADTPGEPVCAGVAGKAALTIRDAVAFIATCAAGDNVTCEDAEKAAAALADGVAGCVGAVAKLHGVTVPTPDDSLACAKRIGGLMDVELSILGMECLGGSPNTIVSTLPREYVESAEELAAFADIDEPKDEEELAAVVEIVGVTVSVLDCVGTMFAVNPFNADVSQDGTSLTSGPLLKQEAGDDSGNSDVPPSLTNLKSPPLNGTAGNEYGQNVKGGKGSSVGAIWRMYEGTFRDYRGRILVVWQNADVSVADDNVKFTKAVAYAHEEAGLSYFLAAAPNGERKIEQSTGVEVSAKASAQKGKDGPRAEVGASRTFFVEYTHFGGNRFRTDSGHTYAHIGGFRKIAKGHRHQARDWAQVSGWVFPPKQHERVSLAVIAEYTK